MARPSLDELHAFLAVSRAGSFTRAARPLGVSQPALSQAIRSLEERLGVRLLDRTTRSVSVTEAGRRLLAELGSALDAMDAALDAVHAADGPPTGMVRLTADRHGYEQVLAPTLPGFLSEHPGIAIEVSLDDAFSDIVEKRFDAGLRLGALVQRDMVSVRVGPDVEVAVVASPGYISSHGSPRTPRELTAHRCVGYRVPRTGALYPWAFERRGSRTSVRVQGSLVLDDGAAILRAAVDGVGLAYLYLDQVGEHIERGELRRVLDDWCPRLPGFHLYHTSRRQTPAALRSLVDYLVAARVRSETGV